MRRTTIRRARTWRWARMRRWAGRSSGPVSLSPSQSCPGCTINTSGYDFRKGQDAVMAQLPEIPWHARRHRCGPPGIDGISGIGWVILKIRGQLIDLDRGKAGDRDVE